MIHLKPQRLQVVMYTGGHGGEFICHWLNQHAECHATNTRILPNNRYILPSVSDATVEIDSQGLDKTFFYPCHPDKISSTLDSKIHNGQASVLMLDNHSDPWYVGYYLFLFLLKTYYYKFSICDHGQGVPPHLKNFIDANQDQLIQQLGRQFYYRHEIENIMSQQPTPPRQAQIDRWLQQSNFNNKKHHWETYSQAIAVDAQALYFGDTEAEYRKICQHANIQPTLSCQSVVDYVQQNIQLIETYSGLGLEAFLNLDAESLKYMLCQMIEQHHNQPWQEEH